ncbi:hypothetical protein [Limnofasciculus baicalensis]|uniref:DUF2808 domain-containing protein n=1 Tax=Limnofasciculus baicalensis BBK-W-15 TaxID=2699891 RepID=A0AAE3KN87_9CYAN|nr:hypothetical protein [Limnofasciculus baicalensis]MCP2730275.1 hypothetical protein [Limnofasciculus baicalensis BBK-W-15]
MMNPKLTQKGVEMMRTLIYAAAFSLIAATAISPDYVSAREGQFTHVDSTFQFPPTKARNFRHTIRLHIPQNSSAVSQLSIDIPAGLTVENDIRISNQSGDKINSSTSINGSKIIITFPTSVAPGSRLNIDLNDVTRLGVSNAWLYHIFARSIDSNADTSIDVAQFRVY